MEKLSDLSSGHPEGPYKAKIQTQAMEHRVLDLDHQAGFLSIMRRASSRADTVPSGSPYIIVSTNLPSWFTTSCSGNLSAIHHFSSNLFSVGFNTQAYPQSLCPYFQKSNEALSTWSLGDIRGTVITPFKTWNKIAKADIHETHTQTQDSQGGFDILGNGYLVNQHRASGLKTGC